MGRIISRVGEHIGYRTYWSIRLAEKRYILMSVLPGYCGYTLYLYPVLSVVCRREGYMGGIAIGNVPLYVRFGHTGVITITRRLQQLN